MPQIIGVVTEDSGSKTTVYNGTMNTVSQNFTFTTEQNGMQFRNKGDSIVTLTVDGAVYKVPPYGTVDVDDQNFTSFDVVTLVGSHKFEITAFEKKNNAQVNSAEISEIKSALAQKASKEDIEKMGSATPKGAYATLSALQTAFPTGTTGIYVVTADGKWYFWNGSTWTAGGTYQATGIADGSVKVPNLNTNIQSFFKTGKNKFDKNAATFGVYIDAATGKLGGNAGYAASDFIPVTPGENLVLRNTNSQPMAWYDANKNYLSGGNTPTAGGYMIAPANAYYNRFSMGIDQVNGVQLETGTTYTAYEPFHLKLNLDVIKDLIPPEKLNLSIVDKQPLQVSKVGNRIRIAWKYDSNNDFWLDFDKLGASQLPQISHMWLASNTGQYPLNTLTRTATQFMSTGSDWVGPYNMKAVNNIDGNAPSAMAYSGGWHGTDGGNTGAATARNLSYKVFVDDSPLTEDKTLGGYKVKIVTVNRIQAKNTAKIDGTGREVLEETVTYTIQAGEVNVQNDIRALEEIFIERYMGVQTNNDAWDNRILFYDDTKYKAWQTSYQQALTTGTTTDGSGCNAYLLNKNNDYLLAWVDGTFGLGKRQQVAGWAERAYTASYGKAYFNLVWKGGGTSGFSMVAEQVASWKGGYKFYRQ